MEFARNPWQVQVEGLLPALENLAHHFHTLPTRVVKDERDGGFLYESDSFAACSEVNEVIDAADQEFAVLSGVLKITRGSDKRLRSGTVYRRKAAGEKDVYARLHDTVQAKGEIGMVTVSATDSQGDIINLRSVPPRDALLFQLARSDSAVAKALRLFAMQDSQSWGGLYRIHEVVQADICSNASFASEVLGSSSKIRRFKRSANSVVNSKDGARHGKELTDPPKDPMPFEEATIYVENILQLWLASKMLQN